MTKKQRRSRLKDFSGVRSEQGKPRKDKIRAALRKRVDNLMERGMTEAQACDFIESMIDD